MLLNINQAIGIAAEGLSLNNAWDHRDSSTVSQLSPLFGVDNTRLGGDSTPSNHLTTFMVDDDIDV
ncbi:MAG: hypothetical protein Tsb002_08740 [Wenzhouxiangellaceae bacterium]